MRTFNVRASKKKLIAKSAFESKDYGELRNIQMTFILMSVSKMHWCRENLSCKRDNNNKNDCKMI